MTSSENDVVTTISIKKKDIIDRIDKSLIALESEDEDPEPLAKISVWLSSASDVIEDDILSREFNYMSFHLSALATAIYDVEERLTENAREALLSSAKTNLKRLLDALRVENWDQVHTVLRDLYVDNYRAIFR